MIMKAYVRLDDIRSIERAKEPLVQLNAFNVDRGFSKKRFHTYDDTNTGGV